MAKRLALTLIALAFVIPAAAQAPRPPMCVIDMGSNTFRRIVGSFADGRYEQRAIEKRTLGVGDEVAKYGAISDAKLAEIADVLSRFAGSCRNEGASPIAAIGTAAFRTAPNGPQVVTAASTLGIAMEIATERRESELAYLVGSLGRDGYAVVDNGSQSIELVARDGGAPRYAVLHLGYRVAYQTFFAAATDAKTASARFLERLKNATANMPFMKGKRELVGIEFGEMAEILFKAGEIEGRILTRDELRRKLDEIAALEPNAFSALKQTKDIDRALPRLVVAVFVTEHFGYERLVLTERELGAGLIIEAGVK
jgi:exopolyphosphatase/guanosine-5'-triphosphate,3'-diphosphate pyrophosphatase